MKPAISTTKLSPLTVQLFHFLIYGSFSTNFRFFLSIPFSVRIFVVYLIPNLRFHCKPIFITNAWVFYSSIFLVTGDLSKKELLKLCNLYLNFILLDFIYYYQYPSLVLLLLFIRIQFLNIILQIYIAGNGGRRTYNC